MLRTGCLQAGHIAVEIQLDLVGDQRNQRSGHSEGNTLLAGGDAFPNLNSGIHHVGGFHTMAFIHCAQISIGFNNKNRIGFRVAGWLRHGFNALVPEPQKFAGSVGIPADVVGVFCGADVAELAVFISQADQRPGCVCILQTQSRLHRPNHLITKGSRHVIGAQISAARNKVTCQFRAGVQGVVDQDTLDVRNGHVLTDLIHKGNVAGQVCVAGNQGGCVFRHQVDLIDDVIKYICQSSGCRGSKRLIHIIFLALAGREYHTLHRNGGNGVGLLHSGSAPAVRGVVDRDLDGTVPQQLIPVAVDGGGGVVRRVHNGKADRRSQTQGIEQRIGLRIVGIHHFLGVGGRKLGHKVRFIGRADADGVVAHTGVDFLGEVVGGGSGLAVGHEDHDRRSGSARLIVCRCGDNSIRFQQLVHGIQNAQLGVCARHIGDSPGGPGHGFPGGIPHTGVDCHGNQPATGYVGFQVSGGSAVAVQRQQHHTVVGVRLVAVLTAIVDDHTDSVIGIQVLQLLNGLVYRSQHGLDGGRISVEAVVHRAG